MSLELVSEVENQLLMRKEVTVTFSAGSGGIKRKDASETVAKTLGLDSSRVFSISLRGESGTTRLTGLFYVYNDDETAKSRLPKHVYLRNRPKVKETEQKDKPKK